MWKWEHLPTIFKAYQSSLCYTSKLFEILKNHKFCCVFKMFTWFSWLYGRFRCYWYFKWKLSKWRTLWFICLKWLVSAESIKEFSLTETSFCPSDKSKRWNCWIWLSHDFNNFVIFFETVHFWTKWPTRDLTKIFVIFFSWGSSAGDRPDRIQ